MCKHLCKLLRVVILLSTPCINEAICLQSILWVRMLITPESGVNDRIIEPEKTTAFCKTSYVNPILKAILYERTLVDRALSKHPLEKVCCFVLFNVLFKLFVMKPSHFLFLIVKNAPLGFFLPELFLPLFLARTELCFFLSGSDSIPRKLQESFVPD